MVIANINRQGNKDKTDMKICFITETVFKSGGIARVLTVLANRLSEGHDITICVFEPEENKSSIYGLSENIRVQYWKHIEKKHIFRAAARRINKKTGFLKKIGSDKLYDFFFFTKDQENYWTDRINDGHYDIVIGLAAKISIMLGRISGCLNCKAMGWQHNSYMAYIGTKREYFWAQDYLFTRYISRLERNIVLNEVDAKLYEEKLGVKSYVIYNPRSFQSHIKSDLWEKRFVAVGALNKSKGYEFLVESSKVFTKAMPEWKVYIYGEGADKAKINKLIEKAGVSQNVFLAGYTSEVKNEMIHSSGLMLSSRWEGMPMVVLEALEIGLPIIAYNISAMSPLVTNGKEGLLVPCFDTAKFADAMISLAKSRNLRVEMGKNACLKSRQFDLDIIIKRWNNLLTEVVNG